MEPPRVSSLDRYDELARGVDARIGLLPATRAPGRLFALHADLEDDDGFALRLIDIGDPKLIIERPVVPLLATALAHSALGWSAPMPEPGAVFVRPRSTRSGGGRTRPRSSRAPARCGRSCASATTPRTCGPTAPG
jgi:hypothetical protein